MAHAATQRLSTAQIDHSATLHGPDRRLSSCTSLRCLLNLHSAGRTLFRLGLSLPDDLPGLLPLWAGGDELPLLPRLRFADVEALQVRVWRLHERVAQRRGAARAGGGMDGGSHTQQEGRARGIPLSGAGLAS